MTALEKLKNTKNRKELAKLLGYKPSALTSIVYKTPLSEKYLAFEIPKKNGGVRTIKAPHPKLKKLQSHLSHILLACLQEIEEDRRTLPASYGFRKGGTITANAKNHKRRRFILSLDLEDFFPSINFGRVRGFFIKDNSFKLNEQVATTIAQIACDGESLPQGSPCSPVISELVGQILDLRLIRFAKRNFVYYSRYADDITFSTNRREFPTSLAFQAKDDPSKWLLSNEIIATIKNCGFSVNKTKTRVSIRGSRQMVTGLVVNEKVNIKSEYYRNARAMCDSLFQSGVYRPMSRPSNHSSKKFGTDYTDNTNPLQGTLSHIYHVTQYEEQRSIQEQRQKPRAIRKLYRRFLFYKYCVALQHPLIITEGKTDPIYLKEAIKHRIQFHPTLGRPENDRFIFSVRFFNYETQTHEILDLGGGTGDLKSIILDYSRNLQPVRGGRKPFSHKPMAYPVVLVVDNDNGLAPIASLLRKMFGLSISTSSTNLFYHITENLYLVKTPEDSSSGRESCIEDLFPTDTRSIVLNNKSFNPSSTINIQNEYGKEVFAKRIVKLNAPNIDFSGFDHLLSRIVAALEHYQESRIQHY